MVLSLIELKDMVLYCNEFWETNKQVNMWQHRGGAFEGSGVHLECLRALGQGLLPSEHEVSPCNIHPCIYSALGD